MIKASFTALGLMISTFFIPNIVGAEPFLQSSILQISDLNQPSKNDSCVVPKKAVNPICPEPFKQLFEKSNESSVWDSFTSVFDKKRPYELCNEFRPVSQFKNHETLQGALSHSLYQLDASPLEKYPECFAGATEHEKQFFVNEYYRTGNQLKNSQQSQLTLIAQTDYALGESPILDGIDCNLLGLKSLKKQCLHLRECAKNSGDSKPPGIQHALLKKTVESLKLLLPLQQKVRQLSTRASRKNNKNNDKELARARIAIEELENNIPWINGIHMKKQYEILKKLNSNEQLKWLNNNHDNLRGLFVKQLKETKRNSASTLMKNSHALRCLHDNSEKCDNETVKSALEKAPKLPAHNSTLSGLPLMALAHIPQKLIDQDLLTNDVSGQLGVNQCVANLQYSRKKLNDGVKEATMIVGLSAIPFGSVALLKVSGSLARSALTTTSARGQAAKVLSGIGKSGHSATVFADIAYIQKDFVRAKQSCLDDYIQNTKIKPYSDKSWVESFGDYSTCSSEDYDGDIQAKSQYDNCVNNLISVATGVIPLGAVALTRTSQKVTQAIANKELSRFEYQNRIENLARSAGAGSVSELQSQTAFLQEAQRKSLLKAHFPELSEAQIDGVIQVSHIQSSKPISDHFEVEQVLTDLGIPASTRDLLHESHLTRGYSNYPGTPVSLKSNETLVSTAGGPFVVPIGAKVQVKDGREGLILGPGNKKGHLKVAPDSHNPKVSFEYALDDLKFFNSNSPSVRPYALSNEEFIANGQIFSEGQRNLYQAPNGNWVHVEILGGEKPGQLPPHSSAFRGNDQVLVKTLDHISGRAVYITEWVPVRQLRSPLQLGDQVALHDGSEHIVMRVHSNQKDITVLSPNSKKSDTGQDIVQIGKPVTLSPIGSSQKTVTDNNIKVTVVSTLSSSVNPTLSVKTTSLSDLETLFGVDPTSSTSKSIRLRLKSPGNQDTIEAQIESVSISTLSQGRGEVYVANMQLKKAKIYRAVDRSEHSPQKITMEQVKSHTPAPLVAPEKATPHTTASLFIEQLLQASDTPNVSVLARRNSNLNKKDRMATALKYDPTLKHDQLIGVELARAVPATGLTAVKKTISQLQRARLRSGQNPMSEELIQKILDATSNYTPGLYGFNSRESHLKLHILRELEISSATRQILFRSGLIQTPPK